MAKMQKLVKSPQIRSIIFAFIALLLCQIINIFMLSRLATLNPNFFFGLTNYPIFGGIAVLISLIIILRWTWQAPKFRPFLIPVIVGSISNLIDRLLHGGVVDYFSLWPIPEFNIADTLIVFGLGGAIFTLIKSPNLND